MNRSGVEYSEQIIGNLLCLPQVLVSLIEACLSGAGVPDLAEIVLQDAALSARVVYAASKSGSSPIDSVEPVTSAIQKLGVPVLTGIAQQAAKQIVAEDFSPEALNYLNGLCFTSRVAGQVARCLAPTVGYLHVEEAQLCGLLLNLGMHAQFSRYGENYAVMAGLTCCDAGLAQKEREHYKNDHLQMAERLIEPWRLDSFLVDAIRFLHNDVAEIENCSQLLKIARLAQEICRQPEQLSKSAEQLGERLFQFRQSEIEYLFRWARGLYRNQAPAQDLGQVRAELKQVRARLIDLIFALADQEGARARLIGCCRPEELVAHARDLNLENSPATEAIFLILDHKNDLLSGIVAPGQPRLISELKIPLDVSQSLVVQSLVSGTDLNSFSAARQLSVTDQLLLRICRNKGFSSHPFSLGGRLFGAVVLGVASDQELSSLQTLRLRMFGHVVSEALAELSSAIPDNLDDGSGLLRQVSNELSNPLTIIGNYAEVIHQLLPEDEHRELAKSIKREVRRIDDVLNYYMNQQELPPFPDQNVSLNKLVYEAVEALQDTDLHPRQIDVRFDLKNDLEKIATNGVLVKQVLVNLLKNAAEAADVGGEISLSTRESYCSDGGRYAEIVVQDNGSGADRALQDQLFSSLPKTKGQGHAGVGLNVVKGMVDDLGGRISYHNSPGAGMGFNLQIPCNEDFFPIGE